MGPGSHIAAMAAYGFKVGMTTESECVAELFKRYQTLATAAAKGNPE